MVRSVLFLLLAACLAASSARAGDIDAPSADQIILRAARMPSEPASLVAFLELRARGSTGAEIQKLVARLGASEPGEAARAAADLIRIGPPAVLALRALASDADAAGAAAARRCLRVLESDSSALTGAVLRLISARRPAGATAALLAFLPHAEDESVVEEAIAALAVVAASDGTLDPALMKALEDPVGLRRAAAVDALSLVAPGQTTAVRKMLLDPVPAVRLRAARALARAGAAEAVSTLIALLIELPLPLALEAEEILLEIAAEQAPGVRVSDDADTRARCRDAWSTWWQGTEDSGPVLEQVRKHTLADVDRAKVLELIGGLGNDAFEVRQRATDSLKALGPAVAPMLRKADSDPDLEVRQRTQAILQEIEREAAAPLSSTLPRILALRKPPEAARVLIAYVPFADNERVLSEVQEALNTVAFRDGKPDHAVMKALGDKTPARRAAAAEALGRGLVPEQRDAVRALLNDPDPFVRVKAALALARTPDRDAVPVLIALTAEPTGEIASIAEEFLSRLSGDHLPPAVAAASGNDATARALRREAWSTWWHAEGDRIDLSTYPMPPASSARRFLSYTLLVQTQNGSVCELDATGRTRWQITGLGGPLDARVLPGGRVLITESNTRRVTERNLKGDILWQKQTPTVPISARRLPNGNTFIVSANRVSEVDRAGREVFFVSRPGSDIMTAQKMRDGNVAIVSNQSALVYLDAAGRELKSVRLQGVSSPGNEVLPNGGVLVPLSWQNKVTEYDDEGKVVWESSLPQPLSACRLPNGHTLVSTQQSPAKIVELDRTGKQVGEMTVPPFVQRATRR
jgi:HEAT repeat protein